jgi:hypothetical protein
MKSQRKGDFKWYYPDYLFRSGVKHVILDNYIKMGVNCSPHIDGFYHIESWPGVHVRWTTKNSVVILKPIGNENKLYLKYFSQLDEFKFRVEIDHGNGEILSNLVCARFGWQEMTLAVSSTSKDNIIITIIADNTWCPKKMGINEDNRELGIAIAEIGLTP